MALTVVHDFDLRATIRQALADGIGPDPREVAMKVMELIPLGIERELLAQLLPWLCREEIRMQRHDGRKARAAHVTGSHASKWSTVKTALLEEAYEVKGTWKHFGDLTIDDVSWLIEDRTKASQELAAEAQRFTNVLTFMRQQRVNTVRKLPREMLEKVMS